MGRRALRRRRLEQLVGDHELVGERAGKRRSWPRAACTRTAGGQRVAAVQKRKRALSVVRWSELFELHVERSRREIPLDALFDRELTSRPAGGTGRTTFAIKFPAVDDGGLNSPGRAASSRSWVRCAGCRVDAPRRCGRPRRRRRVMPTSAMACGVFDVTAGGTQCSWRVGVSKWFA